MFDLREPLAIVCHDAGAANIILAWLNTAPSVQCRAVMQGPAARLWAAARPGEAVCESIEAALDQAESLLSGTGWASDLEHDARRLARDHGVFSVAVIDHWVNYRERFVRHGETVLPDEIWITDDYALAEARRCFPDRTIRQYPNRYLESQIRDIPLPGTRQGAAGLLYILEPARSDWGRGKPGEFQALDYFAEHITLLELRDDTPIRLRPHPSDPPGKYASWIREHAGLHVELDDVSSLPDALARSHWVAGCESFALVVALEAGREVICTLPPWAPACRLPHQGLIHLKERV